MEVKFSKDEILTIYLNRTFLGAGARGFEAAAQRYFGKSATQVNAAEAAMMAGLLKAPSRLAPTDNLAGAQARAAIVIGLMQQENYLSKAEATSSIAQPATLTAAATDRAGGYFADWVMASGPEFFTRNTTEDVLINTTLDQNIQTATEQAVRSIFDDKIDESSKAQVAVVVMSADGAVRAMIGGRNTRTTGAFNRATQAKRQTGSAFKPFVYATALELGYTPFDIVRDEPITYNIAGSGAWSPTNYNNQFAGDVTFTRALAESLNIPAIKISEHVGRDLVRKVATDFGIANELAAGPALALGASESTLIEMTGAYAGILNGGSSVRPYGLEQIKLLGDTEPLAGRAGGIGERVIDTKAAQALTYMMYEVVQSGTGQRAKIEGVEIAGKTGTTQAARDAWFIGFTSEFVVGVWMGYDDNTPLKGVTGGGIPTDIWRETMIAITNQSAPGPLPMLRGPVQISQQLEPIEPAVKTKSGTTIFDTLLGILTGKN
jgi:membrane peptidoglycan carboxypeptidase